MPGVGVGAFLLLLNNALPWGPFKEPVGDLRLMELISKHVACLTLYTHRISHVDTRLNIFINLIYYMQTLNQGKPLKTMTSNKKR